MKSYLIAASVLTFVLPFAASALGQQLASPASEFISSSSPLPDGSIVTTTYYPKLGVAPETRLTVGVGPIANPYSVAAKPSIEQSVLQSNPALVSQSAVSIAPVQTLALPTPPIQTSGQYPIVQVPTWGNPFAGPRRYLPRNYQPANYNVGPPQIQAGYLPSGTVYPYPDASTPPTLLPNVSDATVAPPPSYAGSTRVNYQPLLRFQNLPPGTYMGQGMIGQPTAYVDGQPIRNLLRYIFP